jgi:transcriptional regulator with XRE-family HTH domain
MRMNTIPEPGQRIRQMRVDQNLSREALAIQAGVSGTTVMRAEQGRRVGTGSLVAMFAVLDPDVRVGELANH